MHGNITVRIPVIPGVNDNDTAGFAEIINSLSDGVIGVEFLRYNYLAEGKYMALGKEYTSFAGEAQLNPEMDKLCLELQSKLTKSIKVYYRK